MSRENFFKSVNIWQKYGQKFAAYVFGPPCISIWYQPVAVAAVDKDEDMESLWGSAIFSLQLLHIGNHYRLYHCQQNHM